MQRAKLDAARQKASKRAFKRWRRAAKKGKYYAVGKDGKRSLKSRAQVVRPLGRPDWEDPEMEGAGQQACNDEASASGKSAGSTQI